mgnify:CR=1 FL=1
MSVVSSNIFSVPKTLRIRTETERVSKQPILYTTFLIASINQLLTSKGFEKIHKNHQPKKKLFQQPKPRK